MSEIILSPGVFQIESDQSLYTTAPPALGAAIVGPTVKGRPMVPTYVTTYNQYLNLFGDIFKSGSYYYEYFTSQTAREYFNNGGRSLLVTRIISGSQYSQYATSTVRSQENVASSSFTLETLAWGDQMNNSGSEVSGALTLGTQYNVRWEVTNVNTGSNGGTFTIVVRRGDDNNSQKNILETWANVNLDPQSPSYISRIIGDLKPVYNSGQVDFIGTYANASLYVRVASVTTPNVDSIDNNGNFRSSVYSGSLPVAGTSGSFSGGVADTGLAKNMNETITGTSNIQGFPIESYN